MKQRNLSVSLNRKPAVRRGVERCLAGERKLVPHLPDLDEAGHSFGGLFAVNAFLTKPELFNAYISASPSLRVRR